jgi:phosphate starvation-inducible PhoH-like protein
MKRSEVDREVSKMTEKNRKRKGKKSRKDKVSDKNCNRRDVKADKFKDADYNRVPNITAKTRNQEKALKYLKSKDLVIMSGNAGCGKTFLSCWWAAKQYLEGNIDRIIITRPNVVNGKDGGAVPGTDLEKLTPLVAPMLDNLSDLLGAAKFDSLLGDDPLRSTIYAAPLEKIAGKSFRGNTIVIGDELQLSEVSQIRSLVTRPEDGCQLILLGDPKQAIHRGVNGLSYITDTVREYSDFEVEDEKRQDLELRDIAGIVRFTKDDCVRGGLAGAMVRIFDEQGAIW